MELHAWHCGRRHMRCYTCSLPWEYFKVSKKSKINRYRWLFRILFKWWTKNKILSLHHYPKWNPPLRVSPPLSEDTPQWPLSGSQWPLCSHDQRHQQLPSSEQNFAWDHNWVIWTRRPPSRHAVQKANQGLPRTSKSKITLASLVINDIVMYITELFILRLQVIRETLLSSCESWRYILLPHLQNTIRISWVQKCFHFIWQLVKIEVFTVFMKHICEKVLS